MWVIHALQFYLLPIGALAGLVYVLGSASDGRLLQEAVDALGLRAVS